MRRHRRGVLVRGDHATERRAHVPGRGLQGNKNLLEVALGAGVQRFVYVSVLDGPELVHLDIVRAHEDFVDALQASGIDYAVVRPTGFFSDMGEYLGMARKGRVFLIGSGWNLINPIHGADLAVTYADAVEGSPREIDVGGPEVLTHHDIAELALKSLGKRRRVSSVPVWMARGAVALTRLFDRQRGELLAFFVEAMTRDAVGPISGEHRLSEHFDELVHGEPSRTQLAGWNGPENAAPFLSEHDG